MNFKKKIKSARYIIEAIIVRLGLLGFGAMKAQNASDLAAKVARFVGKKISVNNLAYENLSNALPQLSEKEKAQILDDMWDNLGRVVGEFAHVAKYKVNDIEEIVQISEETRQNIEAVKASGKGGIVFSAHTANWEAGPKLFIRYGMNVSTVYRPLNNSYVEQMTANLRGVDMIEKSSSGNRKILEVIRNGGFVVIMADQKISEGEPVKFFHDDAVTTTSIARLALKYDLPLIPARLIRLGRAFKFNVQLEKPLAFERSSDLNSDILRLTRDINRKLEEWIREYPAQWFWVHNRWKK